MARQNASAPMTALNRCDTRSPPQVLSDDTLGQAPAVRLVEAMRCGSIPREPDAIAARAAQFTLGAHRDHLIAERTGDHRVGAEIFDAGNRGFDAIAVKMDVLGA